MATHRGGIILSDPAPRTQMSQPPSPEQFRDAISVVPTAVTVIAASAGDAPAGATANAVASLSLEPPLMLACLERNSRTLAVVRASGRFSVNVLGAGDEALPELRQQGAGGRKVVGGGVVAGRRRAEARGSAHLDRM